MQNVLVGKRYRLVEKIGAGGMADVYKAVDETLGRTVAVKLMHAQLAQDPSFTARFQQEAKAAANLQSPYIVNIYDWGSEAVSDGSLLYYIVMEYVRGEDLKSIIRRTGALPSAKVAEIGSMVCAALKVAHGYDIIHRDIKPHNIMVLPDGSVKVMDFGIARAGNTQMTQTGSVLGSAHYVSPEQAQGRDLAAASDLYSLGVVLYEAGTGKMPFDGDSPVATALKQVQEQAVRPTSLNPQMDPQLEQVIGFAMAKDPRARYATADAMRRDLLHVARGEPIVGAHGSGDDAATTVMPGVVPLGAGPGGGPADAGTTTVMPAVGDSNAAASSAPIGGRTVPPEPESNKKKIWIWIGIVLALIAAGAIIAWQLGLFDAPPPEPEVVLMPAVTDVTLEVARARLIEAGVAVIVPAETEPGVLDGENGAGTGAGGAAGAIADALTPAEPNEDLITIIEEHHPTLQAGYVIRQDPVEDAELADPANTAVTLTVSLGERMFEIPDLTGMTLDEAREALAEGDFDLESTVEDHNTIPEGQIISQNPDAGEELPGGSRVRVIVSGGVESINVPNVRTMTRQQANTTLTNLGFRVNVTEVFSNDVAEGVVIDQNPREGAALAHGSTVEITVSRGQELVQVPNVINMGEEQAINTLTNAGLRPRVAHAEGDFGIVIAQDPSSGQRVAPGSNVTITIGSGVDDGSGDLLPGDTP